jgi:ribonuclease VapC
MTGIVLDTSVFVSIFKNESSSARLERTLLKTRNVFVPAVCLVELALLSRVSDNMYAWAEQLVKGAGYQLVDLSLPEAQIAATAAQVYGKGSGHRAKFNFGDCLVYAVAKHREMPLLFVCNDFVHTDLVPALTWES